MIYKMSTKQMLSYIITLFALLQVWQQVALFYAIGRTTPFVLIEFQLNL